MDKQRFTVLPIQIDHMVALDRLPTLDDHADPFDRLLIAQCQVEQLTFVSKDEKVVHYGVPVIW